MSKSWFGGPGHPPTPDEPAGAAEPAPPVPEPPAAPSEVAPPPTTAVAWQSQDPPTHEQWAPAPTTAGPPPAPARTTLAPPTATVVLHRPSFRTSLMTAILAVGVVLGFVLVRGSNDTPNSATIPSSTPTTVVVPTTPTTIIQVPATTAPPAPTTTAALADCTAADLSIVTTTDSATYGAGQTVSLTMVLKDLHACNLVPVASGQYNCPTAIVVANSADQQVWPWAGQGEVCSSPSPETLQPGHTETLTASWDQQVKGAGGGTQAPAGSYFAEGTWWWNSGSGTDTRSAASAPFTVP